MTRWLALAAVLLSAGISYADGMTISISSGTGTVINLPPDAQFQIIPATPTLCPECVNLSTETFPPTISTGPFMFKATDGTDCYTEPYINPNGTWPEAATWTVCP